MATTRGFPVPPPLMALGAALAQRRLGHQHPPSRVRWAAAAVLGAASLGLAGSANAAFHRHGTTHNPVKLGTSSALVTDGPFRVTRNPMYVGLTGLLAAQALWRGSLVALLPVPVFAAVIDRLQIPHEEQAMSELFGADYRAYRAGVPRWLGPVRHG